MFYLSRVNFQQYKIIEEAYMKNKDILIDLGFEDFIIFENPDYDSAIIGITDDNRVVYDYDKMISFLMLEDGLNYEDAADFINYNTIRSLPYAGEGAPVIVYSI